MAKKQILPRYFRKHPKGKTAKAVSENPRSPQKQNRPK